MLRIGNMPMRDVVTALASEPGYLKGLAVGYQEEGVDILELPSGRIMRSLTYEGDVYALAWSPDGTMLAAGGLGEEVSVWDSTSGVLLSTYEGHTMAVVDLEFSPDGKWIASTGGDSVHIWNPLNGVARLKYKGHGSYPTCAVWSVQGGRIASGEMLGSVHVWETQTGSIVATYHGQTAIPFRETYEPAEFFAIKAIAFSPSGNLVASAQSFEGETGGSLHVWEVATGRPVLQYPGHPYGTAWSQRGLVWVNEGTLAAVDNEGSAYDFSTTNDKLTWLKQRGQGTGYAACWLPPLELLTTSSTEPVIRSWRVDRDESGCMSDVAPIDEREKIGALLGAGETGLSEIATRLVAQFVENLEEHERLRTLAETAIRLDEFASVAETIVRSSARNWSRAGRFDSALFGVSFAKLESSCRAYLGCALHDLNGTLGQAFSIETVQQVLRDAATYARAVRGRIGSSM